MNNKKKKISLKFKIKATIAFIIVVVVALSALAFIKDYPSIGWFLVGFSGFTITLMLCLSGHRNMVILITALVFLFITALAYNRVQRFDWPRLMGTQDKKLQQELLPPWDLSVLPL
ncbi:MAG: hypothetical protein FWH42_01630 [Dehalococcoidia bacterium]|nr:hypothetical protein [Dehalococcoidia bacterium]